MTGWDPTRVKAQLRLTTQRLGQIQSKKDSEGQIIRRDIATLLYQNNVPIARAKAQKLVREEMLSDVLETLEMHIGVVLERFAELEQNSVPSPALVEAASSIIYATPHIESKDLQTTRDILSQRLGVDFTRSAAGNQDKHVSSRIIRGLSMPPPSAENLDRYMGSIAKSAGVNWKPALLPHERVNLISEILDPTSTVPVIDLPQLRTLSMPGLPMHPPWLRPRIWRLLLGTLPVLRANWETEARKQRDSYYDLTKRLLEPFASLPSPTTPPQGLDVSLLSVSQQLSRVPASLFQALEEEPEEEVSSPLASDVTREGVIPCAANLDDRLRILQSMKTNDISGTATPEIRLEGTPEIRLEADDEPTTSPLESSAIAPSRRPSLGSTLLHSRPLAGSAGHHKHMSALLRLLYIHSCLNPGNRAPHIASILVPLYTVLLEEIEPSEVAHVEADTFWVFEAIVSEFAELEDEEEGNVWPLRLSSRVAWADDELFANLTAKGLDPALPHYSYRWLAPLLAHTLPARCLYPVWDALFSRPERARDINPKVEFLVDVCTSMLMRARTPLFALGKSGRKSPSLWSEENVAMPPPSPLRPWEAGDAFLEGMTLLQQYPIEAAGGIDGILQTAMDLLSRREAEAAAQRPNLTISARIRDTVWRGFTNQPSSPLPELDEGSEEEDIPSSDDETKPAAGNVWAKSLGTTVWRGITNQSAMDAPPSPITPSTPVSRQGSLSPAPSPGPDSPSPTHPLDNGGLHPSSASRVNSLWNYASKLRDSDTAAALAKTSSNWTAKAMTAWSSPRSNASPEQQTISSTPTSPIGLAMPSLFKRQSTSSNGSQDPSTHSRSGSMSSGKRDSITYTPPPRPAFFRPPRDSFMPPAHGQSHGILPPVSPELSPTNPEGFMGKAKHLQDSLASLTGMVTPSSKSEEAPKSAPRPLLLGGRDSVVAQRRSVAPNPSQHSRQWSEVQLPARSVNRDSQSSVSSLAPSDGARLGPGHWDSDSGVATSRIVPLRRSVSPMAPGFRMHHARTESMSSGGSGGGGRTRGWNLVDGAPSPTSSVPDTPLSPPVMVPRPRLATNLSLSSMSEGMVKIPETPPQLHVEDMSDSSSVNDTPAPPPRLRSKRSKPANIQIENSNARPTMHLSSLDGATLAPDVPDADETLTAATPRAAAFDETDQAQAMSSTDELSGGALGLSSGSTIRRSRKVSSRSNSVNTGSARPRVRKVSTGGSKSPRRATARESEAEHGDDEGYDDLLSAYDSEDGAKVVGARAAA